MTAYKTLLLCSCDKSQTFDSEALRKAAAAEQVIAVDQLCGKEIGVAAEHLGASNDVLIACGQQAALFERLAEDVYAEIQHSAPLQSIDIRDRAGWSAPDAKPERLHAKQAALVAAAQLPAPMAPAKNIQSSGVCCIVGPTEKAIRMAELVQDELGVTCIVNDAGPIQLPSAAYDVAKGQLTGAYGALGNFKLEFAHLQPLHPAGRGELGYEAAKPTARSECDVFIDLRGGAPAFPSHEKRNGYFWADPEKSGELERIALTAREMVGEFEKTVYFRLEESLCAHSRANKPGCTRCLDVCPTEAIFSFGDHIQIDSDICAGCGSCAAVCPTSAVTMNETPFEALTKVAEVMTADPLTLPPSAIGSDVLHMMMERHIGHVPVSEGGRLVGMDGENCRDDEKLRRVRALLGQPDEGTNVTAYSDSHADLPLLSWAENGVAVCPSKRLFHQVGGLGIEVARW